MSGFVAVGNAPSSGSTLLGDLLDSSDSSLCGPELNLFSNRYLYEDFDSFVNNPYAKTVSSSIYTVTNSVIGGILHNYALDNSSFRKLLQSSSSADVFLERFRARYAAFRGKAPDAIWFEKTPENINQMGRYLKTFPEAYFIHIVRNPAYILPSLIGRGLSPAVASMTWLFDVAHYLTHMNERVLTVRYENLVKRPWSIVAKILTEVTGSPVESDVVEAHYGNNVYRQLSHEKIDSWGVTGYGSIVDANDKQLDESILSILRQSLAYRIRAEWSEIFGIKQLSMRDALDSLGYLEAVENLVHGARDTYRLRYSRLDILRFSLKYAHHSLATRTMHRPGVFIHPVELI